MCEREVSARGALIKAKYPGSLPGPAAHKQIPEQWPKGVSSTLLGGVGLSAVVLRASSQLDQRFSF